MFDTQSNKAILKIIDFGAASFINPGVPLNKFICTPDYCSPEMLN